jgi:hypothetical protein
MKKQIIAAAIAAVVVASPSAHAGGWQYAQPATGWCTMFGNTSPTDADMPPAREIEVSFHVVGDAVAEITFRPHQNSGVAPVKPGTVAHLALDGSPYLDVTIGNDAAASAPGHFGSLLRAMGNAQTMTITLGAPDDRIYTLELDASFRQAEAQFLKCVQANRVD